ncbi:hypothetical protein BWI17_10955 [Betaproteobacteria bacterium GR16-43]|nr:hypothetical protein BWI17_10955 [Betaproteobacteria bacterium GR16-43]
MFNARIAFATAAAALVLAACSSTSLKDSWKDPAFTGPTYKQVLVLGVTQSDSARRVFEDGFANALRAVGTGATSSYNTLAGGAVSNVQLSDALAKTNSDAALITRVLRVKKDVSVTPGFAGPGFYGRGYGGYYGGAWASAPDVNIYDVITIESTLWNLKADKPVWSATSEVTEPASVAKATEELAKVLIGKMKADGVI